MITPVYCLVPFFVLVVLVSITVFIIRRRYREDLLQIEPPLQTFGEFINAYKRGETHGYPLKSIDSIEDQNQDFEYKEVNIPGLVIDEYPHFEKEGIIDDRGNSNDWILTWSQTTSKKQQIYKLDKYKVYVLAENDGSKLFNDENLIHLGIPGNKRIARLVFWDNYWTVEPLPGQQIRVNNFLEDQKAICSQDPTVFEILGLEMRLCRA